MRKAFVEAVIRCFNLSNHFFLTGDLGFMALEEVRRAFGSRFINAGVAEQNMIGIAAGLSKNGCPSIVYSIAPFCYARPFEQIRNDLCFPNLPVCLVGNGGGYGYGYMGPTHHALEDCGALKAIGVDVKVPAFDHDLLPLLQNIQGPRYLRLGLDEMPPEVKIPQYAPWREITPGKNGVLVALGPLIANAWKGLCDFSQENRPSLWAACEFDDQFIPTSFWQQIKGKPLFIIEEHVAHGGLGMWLSSNLLQRGLAPSTLVHRYALGYPSGHFGSQAFHQAECGLDPSSIRNMINTSIHESK